MNETRLVASPAGEVFEVFARIKAEDPLRYIGNVIAPDTKLAQVYAFTMYQEWTWSEMFIVPRRDIHSIVEAA